MPEISLRTRLEDIRDTLTISLAAAKPNEQAPIAKQLVDVLLKLDSLPSEKESSKTDELASRRDKRIAALPASSAQRQ